MRRKGINNREESGDVGHKEMKEEKKDVLP